MIAEDLDLEQLNTRGIMNMGRHLGIEFTEIGKDYLVARMPVDERTKQPIGILNGGASATLAEIVGSVAGYFSINREKYYCVGLEIKCNHVRAISHGWVYGKATPVHVGKRTHVWKIEITSEEQKLICFSTLTLAILPLSQLNFV